MTTPKQILKKIWHFIWEDESIWSWAVNLILAFVIVKFVIYPLLGLMLGTSLPMVAVVSGSMEHDGSFDAFWSSQQDIYLQYGISRELFQTYKFSNGFNKGDLMIVASARNVKKGDVIVFSGSASYPIIHRVVAVSEDGAGYTTKGDHNLGSRNDEIGISKDKVYGKAVFRLPYLGWFKIGFSWVLGLFGVNVA